MGEKNKPCPKCNSAMEYRLGEFTCNSCGHSEMARTEQPEVRKASGPGFQGNQQWSSQQYQPPPGAAPPPGTLYSDHSYSSGARPGGGSSDGKPIEMHEYILIGCLAFFIPLAGVVFAYIWSSQNRPGAENCSGLAWGWIGINVLLIIIGVFMRGSCARSTARPNAVVQPQPA